MAIPFTTGEIVTAAEMNEIVRAHWRKTSALQVISTVTETDLLAGGVTIDAGAMSTTRMLRLTAWGDSVNNTGSTQSSPRFKAKLGSTTLIDTGALASSWAASASRFGWRIVVEITNLGVANSQWASYQMVFACSNASSVNGTFTTGEGSFEAYTNQHHAIGGNSGAVDTTAAQAFVLSVILPVSSASLDVTLKAATVEIV